jgi:hypothetical protein
MTLPYGFIGYFQVKSDATESYSYITKPVTQDMKDRNIQVLKTDDLTLLSALSGVAIDPARGLALVEAFDCDGKPQPGVHFDESSHSGTPFYIKDGAPNKTLTVSVYNVDSNSADGGFVNLQQGPVIFSAQWNTDGPILGSVNVAIRAGTMTYVDMHF